MIGVFDSGVGGLVAYKELRRLLPRADVAYLADRKNAPYGTKKKDELTELVTKDIRRLKDLGASRILIACCTASAVYKELCEDIQRLATPIILPTAREIARLSEDRKEPYRVTVIATEHTVSSRAFTLATEELVGKRNERCLMTEIAAQKLVTLVEEGNADGSITPDAEDYLDGLCKRIKSHSPEALILGCTHFSHLKSEFEERLFGVKIISPAHLGARELYRLMKKNNEDTAGSGRCLYL